MRKIAIFNDTAGSRHLGCVAVMTNLLSLLLKNNMQPYFYWPVGTDWRSHKEEIVNNLRSADGIIVNGEGTLHSDSTRERAYALLELGDFCRREIKKPCFLINTTLYDISSVGVSLLSKFDRIFVRDSDSERFLLTRGIPTTRCFDLSLLGLVGNNKKHHQATYFSNAPSIMLTGSVVSTTNTSLKELSRELGVPFQDIKPKVKTQQKLLNKTRRLLNLSKPKGRTDLIYQNDHQQWINKIVSYDLVFCGRFHAATLCAGTFTPFVGLESNTPKTSCFVRDVFGNDDRLFNITQVAETARKNERLDFTEEERKSIESYLHSGEQACKKMMDEISRDIGS